jgi:hypothetical protein
VSTDPNWEKATGPEVVEGLASGFVGIVPAVSGIYVWKLAVRTRDPVRHGRLLVDHIDARCTAPVGKAKGRLVGHHINVTNLTVAGKPLPRDKRALLEQRADRNPNFQLWMDRFLETLDGFAPSLYVGETNNLRTRVRAHLNGDTDFGKEVQVNTDLIWEDFDFYFIKLDSFTPPKGDTAESTRFRKSLEWITTMISTSGYVDRAG